jgi:predicted nuclease of predicted toxin-antitoxin system
MRVLVAAFLPKLSLRLYKWLRNWQTLPVWLLDANLDIRVCGILAEFGIESQTAEARGWKTLSNGHLVAAAVNGEFSCLLTRDQLFAQSAAKTLKGFPDFSIVVVRLKQQKWPAYGKTFRLALQQQIISPVPGRAVLWPTI